MIISQNLQKSMIKDMYDVGLEKYDNIEETWPKYMEEVKIPDNAGDMWRRTTVINSGLWRKTAGTDPFTHQAIMEGFTAYGRVYDFTQALCIQKNTIKDLTHFNNILKACSAGWGETAKATRDDFYAKPINKGGVTTGDWIFNGTPDSAIEADPSGDGVYDGTAASPMCLFNLSTNGRTSKGGVSTYYNGFALDLTPDNLKTVWSHIRTNNNKYEDDTHVFKNRPNFLLVSGALEITSEEIFKSILEAYKTTNTANVMSDKMELIYNDYLTDTNQWTIGTKKKGLVAIKRQDPIYNLVEDELGRAWWATAEMRVGFMCDQWRYLASSNMATA